MDNFMDKLAQRLTAQEMIKANSAADASELERLQKQLAQYDACLQEMRKLSLKNTENTDKVSELLDESISKIQSYETGRLGIIEVINEKADECVEKANECVEKANDFVHKENVKVYRNVQAVVVDETKKQTEALEKALTENKGKSTAALVLSIITLVAVAADIALELMIHFNVF